MTAIVTAFDRIGPVIETLRRIESCEPAAEQILVHVDAAQERCAAAIREAYPHIEVMVTAGHVGPGGGRNRLVAAAAHDVVVSFDDDSYPVDRDYFARVLELLARCPEASIVTARVFHAGEVIAPDQRLCQWQSDFSGGACAYRKPHYLEAGGYVPLITAYGMEEVDLALRMHANGRRILQSDWLRVYHDTDRARHADPHVTSASIANIALLVYLRYPVRLWGIGGWQLLNRIQWLLRNGRHRGVLRGLTSWPRLIAAHTARRGRLPASIVLSYLRLRRKPIAVASEGDRPA